MVDYLAGRIRVMCDFLLIYQFNRKPCKTQMLPAKKFTIYVHMHVLFEYVCSRGLGYGPGQVPIRAQ